MNTIPNQVSFRPSQEDQVSFRPPQDMAATGMPFITLMEEAEDDLEAFERTYSGLMDVCDLVRLARLRLIAQMKELEA